MVALALAVPFPREYTRRLGDPIPRELMTPVLHTVHMHAIRYRWKAKEEKLIRWHS